jgi:hypothetical protein
MNRQGPRRKPTPTRPSKSGPADDDASQRPHADEAGCESGHAQKDNRCNESALTSGSAQTCGSPPPMPRPTARTTTRHSGCILFGQPVASSPTFVTVMRPRVVVYRAVARRVISTRRVFSHALSAGAFKAKISHLRETPLQMIAVVVPTHGADSVPRTSGRLCQS